MKTGTFGKNGGFQVPKKVFSFALDPMERLRFAAGPSLVLGAHSTDGGVNVDDRKFELVFHIY